MTAEGLLLRVLPRDGGQGWEVLSPGVGFFALPPLEGNHVDDARAVGVLVTLERNFPLRLPPGIVGVVDSPPAERRHHPVGFGDLLFTVRATGEQEAAGPGARGDEDGALLLRAAQAGRFWRRPAPEAPHFVEPGEVLSAGKTVGILEVMKTFNPIKYSPGKDLPPEPQVLRFLAEDGDEVEEGQPLIELGQP